MPRQGLTGATFGAGTLLISEEDLHSQLAPFGVSPVGFRSFLRAIGVPRIHFPDKSRVVDLFSFQLALRALTCIGRPDFTFPGEPGDPEPASSLDDGTPTSSSLDIAFYRKHWRVFIEELILARQMDYTAAPRELRPALERAADRISLALSRMTAQTVEQHRAKLAVTPYTQPSPYTEDDDAPSPARTTLPPRDRPPS